MSAKRSTRILLVATLVLGGAVLFSGFLRAALDTTLLLADLAGIDAGWADIRPPASRRAIGYETPDGTQKADLYLPADTPGAGLVLVPGAAPGGRNDPRLVALATALARSGFAILVPDIASLRELRLSPATADEIAAAAVQLADLDVLPAGAGLGIGALSVAAGPAVLAALGEPLSKRLDFLLLVGGYHDLERTLRFLTTGYAGDEEGARYREPDPYGKWVYALSNADLLERDADRQVLSALARRKLKNPAAGVDDLLDQLGPSGRAVHDFIANTDPQRVPALLGALPEAVRRDIEALNLAARDLSALEADVILIHGLGDDIIPYTESVALAEALPPGQVELYLLEGLQHVDREFSGTDGWRLWQALQALLSYRL